MDSRTVSTGSPNRLRSFDPVRIARLEYRAWVGYYLRRWPQVLVASVGLVQAGFGMDPYRTLQGAWLVMRANQLWAPFPDNDADGARACMAQFYELVKSRYGEPADPAQAAALEVDWWRVHREGQHRARPQGSRTADDAEPAEELVESLTRLYCYLYREPEAARAERLISTAVLGFAASEAAGRFRHHDQSVIDGDFAELLRWLRRSLSAGGGSS